jgi:hypothetical protein
MPLRLTIPASEFWDYEQQEFVTVKETTITLEHSLYSISKWESKYHKPFISDDEKSNEETLDYIKCMTITQNVDPKLYYALSAKEYKIINDYINDSMTATWFSKKPKPNRSIITAEVIYWQMIQAGIPFECEKWHLNRLLTLLRVCAEKSQPPKKMSKNDIYRQNAALNRQRRSMRKK